MLFDVAIFSHDSFVINTEQSFCSPLFCSQSQTKGQFCPLKSSNVRRSVNSTMFSSRTSAETGNMTPRQFVQIPHPSHAVFKFPTSAKTLTVKFPTPQAQQRVKFPGYARGGMLKLQFDRYITLN